MVLLAQGRGNYQKYAGIYEGLCSKLNASLLPSFQPKGIKTGVGHGQDVNLEKALPDVQIRSPCHEI